MLDVIYEVSRDELDEAIEGGDRAIAAVERMRAAIGATDASSWRDPALRDEFLATLDYQASTYAMLGDYREMVLRQAEWHDTADDSVHAQWDAARQAFETSAAAHERTYEGDVYHPAYNLTAADLGVARAERDLPMAWAARIALVVLAAWLAYGIASGYARAGWPGARAARAMWVAGTRPWRAREVASDLGPVDRALLVAVPAVMLIASRGIQTWFLAPAHVLVMLGSWLVFVLVVLLALGRRPAWPVLAAIGGAAMLRVGLLLAVLAPTGPGGYWFGFWTDPLARSVYITVAVAAFGWVVVAAAWTLATQLGARRATGAAITGIGAVLVAVGGLVAAIGVEAALTAWNDQMALLPWGLSRILGISVYLDLPADTAWWAAVAGVVLVIAGALLALPKRTQRAAAQQH